MKKGLLLGAIAVATVVSLGCCGCNKQIVDLDYKYTKIHTTFDGENYQCYKINSWTDYENGEQLQVDIDGYGKVLISSYNSILIKDKCPYCDKN